MSPSGSDPGTEKLQVPVSGQKTIGGNPLSGESLSPTVSALGALLALRASLHGADDAEALELGRDAGLGDLEGRVREVLENGSE